MDERARVVPLLPLVAMSLALHGAVLLGIARLATTSVLVVAPPAGGSAGEAFGDSSEAKDALVDVSFEAPASIPTMSDAVRDAIRLPPEPPASPVANQADEAKAPPVPRPRSAPKPPAAEDPNVALMRKVMGFAPSSHHTDATSGTDTSVSSASSSAVSGTRDLARSFTRAIPAANTGDPVWNRLAIGDAGSIVVTLWIDDTGGLGRHEVNDIERRPPHLVRLVERTLMALQGGRYAFTGGEHGKETLRIDLTLSERPIESGPLALGFESPSRMKPGRAYFQLPTGRFVEARVRVQ